MNSRNSTAKNKKTKSNNKTRKKDKNYLFQQLKALKKRMFKLLLILIN